MSIATRMTPEELLVMRNGKDFELVNGELPGRATNRLTCRGAVQLLARLGRFTQGRDLGPVFGADFGLRCVPHDLGPVRNPKASFFSLVHLREENLGTGWVDVAPDLANVLPQRDTSNGDGHS